MQSTIKKRVARLIAATLAALMTAGVAAAPAMAVSEARMNRPQAIKRAKYWAKRGVPYSQTGWNGGYRRDCSGLVSYAWDLPVNVTTWRIPLIAKKISKKSLMQGDVLLNAQGGVGGRHVVIFEKWANKQKTAYYGIEQTGATGIDGAVRRKLPYPYKFDKGLYKPYRYTGMNKYYRKLPRSQWQSIRQYKGRVVTPERIAARKAAEAEAKRVAAEAAKIEALKQAALKKAAEQAAAEKAAAAKARTRATEADGRGSSQAAVKEALGSPVAAVRFVARESARVFVGTLVGSLPGEPAPNK